ncbi:MAG: hypothetical protein ACKVUS_04000 [Saprospiraceae bacterium]
MNAINWKMILLASGLFFTGVFVRGEIARRQDLRRELREIKDSQKRIMAQVDSTNAVYAARKLELTMRTDSLYAQIDQIIRLKSLNAATINRLHSDIEKQRSALGLEIHDLKQSIGQHTVGAAKRTNQ